MSVLREESDGSEKEVRCVHRGIVDLSFEISDLLIAFAYEICLLLWCRGHQEVHDHSRFSQNAGRSWKGMIHCPRVLEFVNALMRIECVILMICVTSWHMQLTNMFELNQLASRRLLAPPAARTTDLPLCKRFVTRDYNVKRVTQFLTFPCGSGYSLVMAADWLIACLFAVCQSPGMDCLPGEEVRCEMGRHEGCDCEYIRSCFPRASQCTFFNATHVRTCGFWSLLQQVLIHYHYYKITFMQAL